MEPANRDVYWLSMLKTDKELTAEEKQSIIDEVSEIICEKLKVSEYTAIAEAAQYNIEKVRNAYECLKEYSGKVANVVAFIIASIKNGYCEPVKREAKESKEKVRAVMQNAFNVFQQNEYNFEQIELQLGMFIDESIQEEE